ncbi:unnamed protein product [Caenorhabditis angaria]|uniref:UPAR/Ly6 domain-containing protein n=1 Tax=Caenorhabditis angaria TaxID=860376 RepID=A0A9P1IEG3_9PELO|nr:unnamed protein product [Caenorhabditis angaria]
MLRLLIFFLSLVSTTVYSITCTSCEFRLLPPHSTNCDETCEGDVCFIVVNKYFNGTINAGCMHLREGDEFLNKSVCQRLPYDNRCACNTGDRCNDPKVKLFTYKFTEEPVLVDYQWLPQIQPPMPTFQPIEEILNPENATEIEENTVTENATIILRNEDELTVTTSVGLNIGEKSEDVPTVTQTTTSTVPSVKPTRVIGSIEMTKANEEATPTFATSSSSKNVITSDSKVPDSSNSLSLLISAFIVILAIFV